MNFKVFIFINLIYFFLPIKFILNNLVKNKWMRCQMAIRPKTITCKLPHELQNPSLQFPDFHQKKLTFLLLFWELMEFTMKISSSIIFPINSTPKLNNCNKISWGLVPLEVTPSLKSGLFIPMTLCLALLLMRLSQGRWEMHTDEEAIWNFYF